MKFRLLISSFLLLPFCAFAQNQIGGAIVAAPRPMTDVDSLMVKQLFFDAMSAKVTENYNQAAELFNRVLQSEPTNDAALYQLALLKKDKDNYADAQGLLEKAVAVKPDNEYYWIELIECYEKTNNIEKLDAALDQLIRINPNKTDYYFDKANASFIEKKYDAALDAYAHLEQLMGLDEDIIAGRQKIYLAEGKLDLATADIQALIKANPTTIRYYLLLAELYNSNNYKDKALKTLETAQKIDSNNGQLHLALADVYRDKKDYEACFYQLTLAFAVPSLDIDTKIKILLNYLPQFNDPSPNAAATAKSAALELSKILTTAHPDNYKAYAMYGDMLAQNDKLPEAEDAYKKAIEIDGQKYDVYEQVVRIELSRTETADAIKYGETALSLFPNSSWMNYLVGIAYVQDKNYDKAITYIKNATDLETDDKELLSLSYSSLGDCYHELKDDDKSDAAYDKSITYNPDNAFSLNNYAYYLSLRGVQLDKAAAMSAHSNELQPNTASFEDTYAWILFKQKKYADAKVWIEKALIHDKTNSAVQIEHYGDIMFYLGDTDAAVANWKKAKSFGEQSPLLDRKINERKYVE
jgi:tetratricopeptide (TPR) repeat protein